MRITKIEKENLDIYNVTLTPQFMEKLFGFKEKTIRVRDSGNCFTIGGGSVYYLSDGTKLDPHNYIGKAIDNMRNSF